MPTPVIREGRGPSLETLNQEIRIYVRQLAHVHKTIFEEQKAREQTLRRDLTEEEERPVQPGDYVYVRAFNRSCLDPRAEGPYKVVDATPRAVRVEGLKYWYHLNSCFRAPSPEAQDGRTSESDSDEPGDPGDATGKGDGGEGAPRGADSGGDPSESDPSDPGVRPGTGVPGVSPGFPPQSMSTGDDPEGRDVEPTRDRGPEPTPERREPDPAPAGASSSPTRGGALPEEGNRSAPTKGPPRTPTIEGQRPYYAADLETIGDELWASTGDQPTGPEAPMGRADDTAIESAMEMEGGWRESLEPGGGDTRDGNRNSGPRSTSHEDEFQYSYPGLSWEEYRYWSGDDPDPDQE